MNILVFSVNAWDTTNSFGNTMSNFFDGNAWKNCNFYNIYTRNSLPNNKVCNSYYRMTLIDMLKYNFFKNKIGYSFVLTNNNDNEKKVKNEQKYIDFIHKYSLNFIYPIVDMVYRKKKWLNDNFKKYINDANPDIFFSFLTDVAILKPVIEYVKINTNAKVVLFIADDVYGSYNSKSFFRKGKLKKEFKNILNMADKVYAISYELKKEYSKIFNNNIDVFCKGCLFDYNVKSDLNNPLRFVYAGNLFYGRDKILARIAQTIENNNKMNKQKALLEIYTSATIDKALKDSLNIDNSSIIIGKKSYDDIKKIMHDAEYNLHVESFEKNQIDIVKYSFSTKIIDCLQSGSSILAIGPNNIASIRFIKKVPGACVIDDLDKIENEIIMLINNKKEILKNAETIRKFALENFNIEKNQKRLKEDFLKLKNEK